MTSSSFSSMPPCSAASRTQPFMCAHSTSVCALRSTASAASSWLAMSMQ